MEQKGKKWRKQKRRKWENARYRFQGRNQLGAEDQPEESDLKKLDGFTEGLAEEVDPGRLKQWRNLLGTKRIYSYLRNRI
jgi:hypothetical protein